MVDKELSAVFLSFLIILTPFANVYLVGDALQQPKVSMETFVKTVEVGGKNFNLQCLGRITEYANGTKKLEFSVTIENLSKNIIKISLLEMTSRRLATWPERRE